MPGARPETVACRLPHGLAHNEGPVGATLHSLVGWLVGCLLACSTVHHSTSSRPPVLAVQYSTVHYSTSSRPPVIAVITVHHSTSSRLPVLAVQRPLQSHPERATFCNHPYSTHIYCRALSHKLQGVSDSWKCSNGSSFFACPFPIPVSVPLLCPLSPPLESDGCWPWQLLIVASSLDRPDEFAPADLTTDHCYPSPNPPQLPFSSPPLLHH